MQRGHLSTPRLLAGGDADLNRLFGGIGLDLTAKLAWVHDFGSTIGRTDAVLDGALLAGFSTLSSRTGRDAVLADIRAAKTISETVSAFVEYGVDARSRDKPDDVGRRAGPVLITGQGASNFVRS